MPDTVIESFSKRLNHVDFMAFMTVNKRNYELLIKSKNLRGRVDSIEHYKRHLNQALRSCVTIKDPEEKAQALTLLEKVKKVGGLEETTEKKESQIEVISLNVMGLIKVAKELAETSQVKDAVDVFNEAKKEAEQSEDKFEEILSLISIAKAQMQVTYKQESQSTFALAIQKVQLLNYTLKDRALHAISITQAVMGQSLDAIKTTDLMKSDEEKAHTLAEIGKVQARVGLAHEADETFRQAVETTKGILTNHHKSKALAVIGSAQLETNRTNEAFQSISMANHFATNIPDNFSSVIAIANIALKTARVR